MQVAKPQEYACFLKLKSLPAVTSATSGEVSLLIEEEVKSLLQKEAIMIVPLCEDQFISWLFLVERKEGSYHPVVNLKPLNEFIQKAHFKMEGVGMIKHLLQPGDWMCSLDLKDAYFSVPIAKEDHNTSVVCGRVEFTDLHASPLASAVPHGPLQSYCAQ